MSDHREAIKSGIDYVAAGTAGAAWIDLLPDLAAGVSLLWLLVRLYETRTVQTLLPKWLRLPRSDK